MLLNIRPFHFIGRVAQLAEHSTLNRQVGGSIPPASTMDTALCVVASDLGPSVYAGFTPDILCKRSCTPGKMKLASIALNSCFC
jgi:hypothetical protein